MLLVTINSSILLIALPDEPRVLKVRLDGPRAARLRQAMRIGEIDEATPRRTLDHLDRTHADYARELDGADITAFEHYDLMIDSTRVPIETCIQLICAVARAGGHRPSKKPSPDSAC